MSDLGGQSVDGLKAVILAGGLGSRLQEETDSRPKPMVEIGGRPILWHIMKIYSHYGVRDFVICLGYRGYMIKEYFANYVLHGSNVTVDLGENRIEYEEARAEPWRVTLVDTGDNSMTGGRLRRVARYLPDSGPFFMTYGDGVADIDIHELLKRHQQAGTSATMTTVRPPGRYGATVIEDDRVVKFIEKPAGDGGYINGGFFVLDASVIDLIEDDSTIWELEPLETLARTGQLAAYRHRGFWLPMDTLRDRSALETLWASGSAPWQVWT